MDRDRLVRWLAAQAPIRKLKVALAVVGGAAAAAAADAAGAYDWDGLGPWGPFAGAAVTWGIAWAVRMTGGRRSPPA